MSEGRLEQALRDMSQESVDDAAIDAARARVWDDIVGAAGAGCAEFRDFQPYLSGTLADGRRVLMEDHLSRCAACRASLAQLKGERRVVAMPARSISRWARGAALAAAAALVLAVAYGARDTVDAMLAPSGPRATVVSVEGGVYRLAGDALATGATITDEEVVRTGPNAHAVLRLADGSTVDVNERTELFATAAWSGQTIHLQRGDVVVQAAKQRRGHLRVVTRDSIASVKGTVFAVSAGLGGSVVSVVEGAVQVNQPGREVLLKPGQQAASNPALASSVAQAVAWSPSADEYLQLLASFATIEQQLADAFPTEQRHASALLAYLPAGAFAYGSVPNLGGRLGMAVALAEQQSSGNTTFGTWWSSETGQSLRQMVDRLQSVSSLLGDEVVFSASAETPGEEVPMVMARVQPGRQTELIQALDGVFAASGASRSYSVSDDLMVVSSSPQHLTWALGHLRQGATSPFAAAIGERYRRGTGWLMGIDASALAAETTGGDAPPRDFAAMTGLQYVFAEQRATAGGEENELTVMFDGQRKGVAAWLADAGSGGAAEYLPADALVGGYVSVREPWQLFQDFTALMLEQEGSSARNLARVEEKLGAGFVENLTKALGNEAAFTLNGISVSGPRFGMAALAYNPSVIDDSLRTFMDAVNAELAPEKQGNRVVFGQENVGGRTWNTMTSGQLPVGVTWTYDQGYLVAASDRATAQRMIATRNGGSPLVWSQDFQRQLPFTAGMHPSAFGWLNTKGSMGAFPALSPESAAAKLLAQRDPVLVVFDGQPEQIHGASRARLPGMMLDVMMLGTLMPSRTGGGVQSGATQP